MDLLIDIAHWAFHDGLDGTVVVGALLLAWLVRRAEGRSLRSYDAWWFRHTPRPHL
jgi:uncharacterized protein (TIGR03382 family)